MPTAMVSSAGGGEKPASIRQYINEKRILEAKRRILTGVPASKVCYDCGYSDYSTFARRFKEIVGVAPSMLKDLRYNFLKEEFKEEFK